MLVLWQLNLQNTAASLSINLQHSSEYRLRLKKVTCIPKPTVKYTVLCLNASRNAYRDEITRDLGRYKSSPPAPFV